MVTEHLGWIIELGLNRRTRFYIGRPVFYTGAVVLSMATLLVGGSVVVNDYRNPDDAREVWADYQRTLTTTEINRAFFLPQQIRDFVSFAEQAGLKAMYSSLAAYHGKPIAGSEKG